jgi:hypothetical protein
LLVGRSCGASFNSTSFATVASRLAAETFSNSSPAVCPLSTVFVLRSTNAQTPRSKPGSLELLVPVVELWPKMLQDTLLRVDVSPDTKLILGVNQYSQDTTSGAANAATGGSSPVRSLPYAISRHNHDAGTITSLVEECLSCLDLRVAER